MQHLRINKELNDLIDQVFDEKEGYFDSKTELARTAMICGLKGISMEVHTVWGVSQPTPKGKEKEKSGLAKE